MKIDIEGFLGLGKGPFKGGVTAYSDNDLTNFGKTNGLMLELNSEKEKKVSYRKGCRKCPLYQDKPGRLYPMGLSIEGVGLVYCDSFRKSKLAKIENARGNVDRNAWDRVLAMALCHAQFEKK